MALSLGERWRLCCGLEGRAARAALITAALHLTPRPRGAAAPWLHSLAQLSEQQGIYCLAYKRKGG